MSLVALVLSTLAYGLASHLQGVGVARAAGRGRASARTLRGLASLPFLAGVGLDLVGVGLGSVALRELPLFLVQAAGVASVGVTAVLAVLGGALTDRVRLARGLVAGIVGCALLTAAASPAPAEPLPVVAHLALGLGLPLAGVLALVAAARAPRGGGLTLTTVSGLAFAGVGLCLRGGASTATGTAWIGLLCAVVLGLTGTVLFALALERTPVTAASGVLAFTELVVPAAVGLAVLGDRVREGFEPVALAGCALVALALAELTAAESGHPGQSSGAGGGPGPGDDTIVPGAVPAYDEPARASRTVLPARV